jgi:hypothetical protein
MLTTWFDLGLNGDDCLTCAIDGRNGNCTGIALADVCRRSLFLTRFVPQRFDQCLGLQPRARCIPVGCNNCR